MLSNDNSVKTRHLGKTLLLSVLVVIVLVLSSFSLFSAYNYCASPVDFSIGQIDSRFGVSRNDLTSIAKDAADRWNKAAGKTKLVYEGKSLLQVNLVYDDRQANFDKLRNEQNDLGLRNKSLSEVEARLQDEITNYKTDLNSYNSEVNYWNSRGGAAPEEFNKLLSERSALKKRAAELSKSIALLGNEVNVYNGDVTTFNSELKTHKNAETAGTYDEASNIINIYLFGNTNDLRLVLMHELGHALGAGHTQDPQSMMYYLNNDQKNSDNPSPTSEDLKATTNKCLVKARSFWGSLRVKLSFGF